MTTCFVKISMVLIMARESLGVQQIPPNIVIYGLSLILSCYVMGPVYNKAYLSIEKDLVNNNLQISNLIEDYNVSAAPLKDFLYKFSSNEERSFFLTSLKQFWPNEMLQDITEKDLIILVPSFMVSEITNAFKIGFLIYLPSIIIDVIISNILMAMGMMMMSPVTISLPIKLLLFISIDGWSRLVHLLLNSY
jgi:type III secretion protein R